MPDPEIRDAVVERRRDWVYGSVFASTAFGSMTVYNKPLRNPNDNSLDDNAKQIHMLCWYYVIIAREEVVVPGDGSPLRGIMPSLFELGSGTSNKYFAIAAPGTANHDKDSYFTIATQLKKLGYYPWEYDGTAYVGAGRLPYGLGVRVAMASIQILSVSSGGRRAEDRDVYQYTASDGQTGTLKDINANIREAYTEVSLAIQLGRKNLAPPVVACIFLQRDQAPWNATWFKDNSFGNLPIIDGEYNVVGIYGNGECDLDTLFDKIKAKGFTWAVQNDGWLVKVGDAIAKTIRGVSQEGILLLDSKPANFLYVGQIDQGEKKPAGADDLTWKRPKVWATDFDVVHAAVIPPSRTEDSKNDFECIELLNLLLFLNTVQCFNTSSARGWTDPRNGYSPVGQVVMQPLRRRLRELGGTLEKYKSYDLDGPVGSNLLCAFMVFIESFNHKHPDGPLFDVDKSTLNTNELQHIIERLHGNVKHYAGKFKNQDRGCYPYRPDSSLFTQMFIFLKTWHWSVTSDRALQEKYFPDQAAAMPHAPTIRDDDDSDDVFDDEDDDDILNRIESPPVRPLQPRPRVISDDSDDDTETPKLVHVPDTRPHNPDRASRDTRASYALPCESVIDEVFAKLALRTNARA